MDVDFCWEDSTTGCICGNECEPPKWMQEMWEKENEHSGVLGSRAGDGPVSLDRSGVRPVKPYITLSCKLGSHAIGPYLLRCSGVMYLGSIFGKATKCDCECHA
jgi:hypothetical protein